MQQIKSIPGVQASFRIHKNHPFGTSHCICTVSYIILKCYLKISCSHNAPILLSCYLFHVRVCFLPRVPAISTGTITTAITHNNNMAVECWGAGYDLLQRECHIKMMQIWGNISDVERAQSNAIADGAQERMKAIWQVCTHMKLPNHSIGIHIWPDDDLNEYIRRNLVVLALSEIGCDEKHASNPYQQLPRSLLSMLLLLLINHATTGSISRIDNEDTTVSTISTTTVTEIRENLLFKKLVKELVY